MQRDTSSLNLNVIKEGMTERISKRCLLHSYHIIKEVYPSNSILDIRVERCWFIFMIHFPSATFQSLEVFQNLRKLKTISKYDLDIFFLWWLCQGNWNKTWAQVSHADNVAVSDTLELIAHSHTHFYNNHNMVPLSY